MIVEAARKFTSLAITSQDLRAIKRDIEVQMSLRKAGCA
jgi:hypothetical protein